jgi:hypothetical protein
MQPDKITQNAARKQLGPSYPSFCSVTIYGHRPSTQRIRRIGTRRPLLLSDRKSSGSSSDSSFIHAFVAT